MKRFLCLGAVLFLSIVWAGCGEVFRPIIIPNPPQFPNPAASHSVVTVSDNGDIVDGGLMSVDVSGDTNVGQRAIGLNPVHATMQTANQMLIVNQSNSTFPQDTVTKVIFTGVIPPSSPIPTITLPISYDAQGNIVSASPNFVATTEGSRAYVSMPLYQPPQNQQNQGGVVVPSIAVLNTAGDTFVATLPVGQNPIAMAETPNGTKLYVANQGSGTLNAFNTSDLSSRGICDPTGTICPPPLSSPPIWISGRSDSQQVYVLEQNGTLAYLTTATTAGPDTFAETSISTPGAATMWYDMILNRLYIAYAQSLAIIDVSGASQPGPVLMATISIPPFSILPSGTTVPATAVAATSLPDGSRAYVGSYATLPSAFTVNSVSGDGSTATYNYTLTSGHDLTAGVLVNVTGTGAFDGTSILVTSIVSGGGANSACTSGVCFTALNTTFGNGNPGTGSGSNIFPQITVVTTSSNTIKTTAPLPGFFDATNSATPYYAPICATTRFRFNMAAGGDSTRTYFTACDAGVVDIVNTSTDTYYLNLPAPGSAYNPIPPSQQPPAQNPTFMLSGP